MPSTEECIKAQAQVKEWAIQQLIKEGHNRFSAEEIVKHMDYNKQISKAENLLGNSIYRGPYSPY